LKDIATMNWDGWDGPWHVSPLTGDASGHPYSINKALQLMLEAGIPSTKIGIGTLSSCLLQIFSPFGKENQ
jgi:hypothetical protein